MLITPRQAKAKDKIMKVSIIGCGDSAKEWFKVPCDMSVGVNDCVKFGHEVDNLVVVNSPVKFFPNRHNNHTDRIKTIANSKPKRFFCHNGNWKQYFPKYELLGLRPFNGTYKKGRIYSSGTSPMVAITLAVSLGATELIIWGVDFVNHQRWRKGQRGFDLELSLYQLMFEELAKEGIKVWLGNEVSELKKFLPKYISSNQEVMNT
jgi:hypothetical protein